MDLSDFDSLTSSCKHCKWVCESGDSIGKHFVFVWMSNGVAICKSKKQIATFGDFKYDCYPYFYLNEDGEKKEGVHQLNYRCVHCNHRELSKFWERSQHFNTHYSHNDKTQTTQTIYTCALRDTK